ncbi:hypothetical protein LS482_00240 [Sinomicrobium kalidii]|uniref:hypothetical protein n=1 Tax=Sinomicrobium kalidii TaxID=2900738 RepID=UPI001E449098|nr:hypothetical protein [Sinomicrobium kalidii]UGU16313.1 hypothetical protein LS482_00240 [Sinomicrobium kalidii]
MIVVKVTYTVKAAFAEKNMENIRVFMSDFKKQDTGTFRYNVYVSEDKKTFTHLSHYKDKAIQDTLLNVPSFLSFQQQRDESGLEKSPVIEVLTPVTASSAIF